MPEKLDAELEVMEQLESLQSEQSGIAAEGDELASTTESVTATRLSRFASFSTVMVAPGTPAFELSRTIPEIWPVSN